MIDTGASGYAFIDSNFALRHNIPLLPCRRRRLLVVDGEQSSGGDITQIAMLHISISQHTEPQTPLFVTKLGQYPMIFGIPWLHRHNPTIDFNYPMGLSFNTIFCQTNCLPARTSKVSVQGIYPTSDIDITPEIVLDSTNPSKNTTLLLEVQPSSPKPPSPSGRGTPLIVGAAAFHSILKMNGTEVDAFTLQELTIRINELRGNEPTLNDTDLKPPPPQNNDQTDTTLQITSASAEDITLALKPKAHTDPKTKLPKHFYEHLPTFDRTEADKLPPRRDCDLKIDLKEGTTPGFGPLYSMSREELLVLKKFLEDNLRKGFIRPSSSSCASPVLFARKPGGGLRFCVDYRALNAITIKNRYPLPLLQETLSRLSTAKWFTKLDVIAAFNKIRIADGHEYLTAFRTRYGLYESLVMNFGLSNAPAAFQARINEVLRPFLDQFCTAFIDDVLVYSDNLLDHRAHVHQVIRALGHAGLHLDIDKCEFEKQEVKYLGMIVSTDGVKMDPEKVTAILQWAQPENLKDVQAFLGFANFYRRFIIGFSKIVAPLIHLTRKGTPFNFDDNCKSAMKRLQISFTSAPILRHFDPTKQIHIETDASDWVSAGILSQEGDVPGILHPVAFFSKKHSPAECNYEIYDKELLAVIRAFEEWRPESEGAAHQIIVHSDHRNLEYFMTTKDLTRRQVRWSEFLQRFDVQFKFIAGKDNGKADSLTRRTVDLPRNEEDDRKKFQQQTIIKNTMLSTGIKAEFPHIDFATLDWAADLIANPAIIENIEPNEPDSHTIARLLESEYPHDTFATHIISLIKKGGQRSREISLSECTVIPTPLGQDRLYFRGRLYVPGTIKSDINNTNTLRVLLMKLAHNQPSAGHYGAKKYYELISREYYWPHLMSDLKRYVANCHLCQKSKVSRRKFGFLKPLPIPAQRWTDISVDFIGPLPLSNGYDCIMVTVDRLSKARHYDACATTDKAPDLARTFIHGPWKHHGTPSSMVSDRGPTFIAEFWKAVCYRLQIKQSLSTAYHPETDGQTEISNAFLEQYLRMYVDYTQADWEDWLPLAEFAANNAVNESTGMTPFFANHGFHPRMSFTIPKPTDPEASKYVRNEALKGNAFADRMETILTELRTNLSSAQRSYEFQANKHRVPAPAYRAGDQVWLDSRNLKTDRPMKKLDFNYNGPFLISRTWSHHYELKLPPHMIELGIHNKFHTTLLRPFANNPHPGQTNPPPPPIAMDEEGNKLYAIDRILDSKRVSGVFHYLVKWKGYEKDEDHTWLPLVEMVHLRNTIIEYEKLRPRKARPRPAEITKAKASRLKRQLGKQHAREDTAPLPGDNENDSDLDEE